MNNYKELFRVFVNFANETRNLDDEQQLISQLRTCVGDLIEPLALRHRIDFSLDVCQKTFKQWLIVSVSVDLQFSLFSRPDAVVQFRERVDDLADEAASERMLKNVRLLRELSEKARWNPSDFYDAISTYKAADVRILNTLRDRRFEVQTANGQSAMIDALALPRRTLMAEPVDIQFTISSLGNSHVDIELLSQYRRLLKTQHRLITMQWTHFEFPDLTDQLFPALRSQSLVSANAYRLVDPLGVTKSLSLNALTL